MAKSAKKVDTDSNVSNERIDLINDAVNKVQGSNAALTPPVTEWLVHQGQLDSLESAAKEDAAIGLGETVDNLVGSGQTSMDWTAPNVKDFTLGKDDAAFKGRKAFYDDAKRDIAFGYVTAKDYGLPNRFLERDGFNTVYGWTKKKIEKEGLQPAVYVALETAKSDANQSIRKIRERMRTIEKGDDKTPKVESTNFEKDLKDFQRLINRLLSREDLPADEVEHKLIALKQAAGSGGYSFLHDLKFDVE
tara:strand:- start:28 stop:771 length:744 start_codon:yes stop_codon:yes gene_type:complete